jgi:hypothetical protein
MRCTRCNRPAVPQAVGRTPEGDLVFGWCLACLEATGCREIVAARPVRRASTALVLQEPRAPRLLLKTLSRARVASDRRTGRAGTADPRRRVIVVVAWGLWLWGLTLVAAGVVLRSLRGPNPPRSVGPGNPVLLIGGGAATALVALFLLATAFGNARPPARPRAAAAGLLRLTQLAALLGVLALLATVLLRRDRRPVPYLVLTVTAALALAARLGHLMVRRPTP